MQGCGVTKAVLLTPAPIRAARTKRWSGGRDLRTFGVGRSALDRDADGIFARCPEGRRRQHWRTQASPGVGLAGNAARLRHRGGTAVPVMMHIQVFPHFPGETAVQHGISAIRQDAARLSAHELYRARRPVLGAHQRGCSDGPRLSAGPIKAGGLTDRWLSDFPNLYADMSANSGNNALSRDTDFSRGFIDRHKSKLIFGSDCSCTDGKGAGVSQNNNPEASRLAGKCVARETLVCCSA